ncbi:MAG: inorganic pyrophosphatase [Clostridia bacterium]|nr:inorganic pyrophosphatase [Clostridia bacterium]
MKNDVIGSFVKGIVDRPMGTAHPGHSDLIYEVNYGYVSGVYSGDGEEQDAYILGAGGPIESFEGRVIAIYHRSDDVEDKWIVSLDERDYSDEEILEAIRFQERFFRGELIR